MRVERFIYPCLGHQSYLILDEKSRVGAVIDPQPDIWPYLAFCETHGYEIRHILLTQAHRDFEPGHRALADATGAEVYASAAAETEVNVTPVRRGDVVDCGQTRLVVRESPSFAPESISLVVYDLALSPKDPIGLFSGRLISAGDVERPDLDAWWGTPLRAVTRSLHQSLEAEVLSLPDWTLIYPARNVGAGASTTVGVERVRNHVLRTSGESELYDIFWGGASEDWSRAGGAPEAANAGVLSQRLRPVTPDELIRARNSGAQILDVRSPEAFAAAHLAGSLNFGLEGPFATWARALLDPERPILLIAPPRRELEAAIRLSEAGLDQVAGYLKNGMAALDDRPQHVRVQPRLPAIDALSRNPQRLEPTRVDVRRLEERVRRPVEASVPVPLERMLQHFPKVPKYEPIAVFSERGYRSSIAASLLAQAGFNRISVLIGGVSALERIRRES